jgi:hypothetical protein
MAAKAAFPASTSDLKVDLPEGKLIEPLGLRLPSDRGNGRRRASHEFSQVILHAHDDSLRLSSAIHYKAFFILLDPPQNLPELSPGG